MYIYILCVLCAHRARALGNIFTVCHCYVAAASELKLCIGQGCQEIVNEKAKFWILLN